jgi:hypothetical protein
VGQRRCLKFYGALNISGRASAARPIAHARLGFAILKANTPLMKSNSAFVTSSRACTYCTLSIILIYQPVPRDCPTESLECFEQICSGNEVNLTGILNFKRYFVDLPRFCPGAG